MCIRDRIIALLGGRENIVLVDACMTRLRVTVKDPAKVADLAAWKAEGALSPVSYTHLRRLCLQTPISSKLNNRYASVRNTVA